MIMGFLDNIFGNKNKLPNGFKEKDNIGTRHDNVKKATADWISMISKGGEPFIMYNFDKEGDARDALLNLPCIHVAEDSDKLICTEPLYFGYYHVPETGKYEAVLMGNDLSYKLWKKAKISFSDYGGTLKNYEEPEKSTSHLSKTANPEEIVFVREDKQGINTYVIYKGPDAVSAKVFLQTKPVTQRLYYIIVETPEGNYGRDISGMYKE